MSEKPPWRQTTKTVRLWMWAGCGLAVVGLSDVVVASIGRVDLLRLIIGAGFLAIGLIHLTSAVAMRRRQRSSSVQDDHPTMRDSAPRPSDP